VTTIMYSFPCVDGGLKGHIKSITTTSKGAFASSSGCKKARKVDFVFSKHRWQTLQ
jgi:hypothetical protein